MTKQGEIYDKPMLENLYLVEHMTLAEIGSILGISRQLVHYRIKACRIDTSKAERFDIKCDVCGKEYSTTRKRYKLSELHLCSTQCYYAYMKNDKYKQSRNGQRIARRTIEEDRGWEMKPGEVVHHKDGDTMNNDIKNLMVFSSHSEHLKHHHEIRRQRINQTKSPRPNAPASQ